MPIVPLSPLAKAALAMGATVSAALAATVAGMSVEGFLALILAMNGVELGLIVHNTGRISNLHGRYDADHD